MSEPTGETTEHFKPNCVFCRIAYHKEPNVNYYYQDDNYVVFPDHRPAAKLHLLIIPKRHIKNLAQLTRQDIPMLQEMKDICQNVLQENGANMSDVQYGLHWPFQSVPHLHVHAISPATSEMSAFQKFLEFNHHLLFGSVEEAIQVLEKKPAS